MHNKKLLIDERSYKKLLETATVVLLLFYIVCPVEMLIKIIVTRDPTEVLGEIIILLSITTVFLIVHRLDKDYSPTLPRKSNGEQLSAEETKVAKQKRMLIYLKESILSTVGLIVAFEVFDYFLKKQIIIFDINYFINKLISIVFISIIFFTINSIYNEKKIKAYNKSNDKLDK